MTLVDPGKKPRKTGMLARDMAAKLHDLIHRIDENAHDQTAQRGALEIRVAVPLGPTSFSMYQIEKIEVDGSGQSFVITVKP